jgi:hypothetical protein
MRFDPAAYGPEVAAILSLDGGGERLMPLVHGACSSGDARKRLAGVSAKQMFPRARDAPAALSGLWLYFSCWDEAHQIAQDIDTREGRYWHAILHRQEPDAWNAAYWFRQVGPHPIFAGLHQAAKEIGVDLGAHWNPVAFIEKCEQARVKPGSELERQAMAVQQVEWQLLFDFCAAARTGQLR